MFSSNPTRDLSALLSKLFDLDLDNVYFIVKETCANVKAKLLEQAQQISGSILAWDDRMTDNAWVEVSLFHDVLLAYRPILALVDNCFSLPC
jgi:hypothetical protein